MTEKLYIYTIQCNYVGYDCMDFGTFEQLKELFYKTKLIIELENSEGCKNKLLNVDERIEDDYLSIEYTYENELYIKVTVEAIPKYEEDDSLLFGETINDIFRKHIRN